MQSNPERYDYEEDKDNMHKENESHTAPRKTAPKRTAPTGNLQTCIDKDEVVDELQETQKSRKKPKHGTKNEYVLQHAKIQELLQMLPSR